MPGWSVYVNSSYRNKEYLSNPITSIRNEPIVKLHQTFLGMENLKAAPKIPNTVIIMSQTFQDCISLETASSIPNSVTLMHQTFFGCKSLKTPPKISTNVEDMFICFAESGITSLPNLTNCNKLKSLMSTFYACNKLVDASNFVIPNSVTNCVSMFWSCNNLEKAPKIPNSVTDAHSAFANCTKLSGTLTVNSTNLNYLEIIKGTKIQKVDGNIPDELKNAILQTK